MRYATLGALALLSLGLDVRAALLDRKGWTVTGPDALKVTEAADGDIRTHARFEPFELARDFSVTVDLGAPHLVYRVYLTDGAPGMRLVSEKKQTAPPDWPGHVQVFVGDEPYPTKRVAEALLRPVYGAEIRDEIGLRFPPARGRYVRFQLGKKPHAYPWIVAEIEVGGWRAEGLAEPADAVVCAPNAPAPLALAARELSYYLGVMLGRPVPVVAPDAAERYPGTRYRVEDLKPLAQTVEAMRENQASAKIPATPVHVEQIGREVVFSGFPYRNVLWGVWAFLEAQGVRWVYPDPLGDFVPRRATVDLSMLPLKQTPSAPSLFANFAATALLTGPRWDPQAMTEGYLYWWRNRWTHTWADGQSLALGGAEVPKPASDFADLPEAYQERFDGFPHNFNAVLPDRILQAHPDWWGVSAETGERVPPGPGAPTFCMSNPEVVRWIAEKAVAVAARDANPAPRYWLLPMDAARYCACAACKALNASQRAESLAWCVIGPFSTSEPYYHLVNEVAKQVKAAAPQVAIGALAYANVHAPPQKIERFEDNVIVQLCIYGEQNLPLASPRNAAFRERLKSWQAKCKRLEHYDYVLLQEKNADLPRPMALGIADRARFLHGIGALAGGTQASPENLARSPWVFYLYARMMWDVSADEWQVLKEFTECFYREAAAPMLAYIGAMERYHVANDISLRAGAYASGVPLQAFPYPLLRELQGYLGQARAAAAGAHWTVRARVEEAASGLRAVLAHKGLSEDDLRDEAAFPALAAASEPLVIDLMQSRIHPEPRGDPKTVILYHDRRVGEWIRVREAGRYTVRLETNGFDKPPRPVTIWFGSRPSAKLEVPAGIASIEAAFEVPAGLYDVFAQGDWGCGAWGTARMTVAPAVAAAEK